ncbi:MBL fold metallo-hydrolase [Sphingomicrobium sediminis]|uniref:MBL fold metallo-hydrolase n=1 Tax=Sphingomicrobium sediminis TaxID=2950949 RepID=A0A9X2J2Q0_9SPHN|nr:MBL fold metallo-hydrolase [Sphingomicrobium sediminis]MCM8557260.1 MBL fold metallo-hydrolase [Sphingomicrobium sediminis]
MRTTILAGLAATTALVAAPAAAQDMDDVEITVECVSERVCVLFGQGGNIALQHGEDGNILVDDQFAPLTPKILAAVASVNDAPVEFVVNTHYHGDHTGGNENLADEGALVLAHDNVRKRIAERIGQDMGHGALPVLTFESGVDLEWNGEIIGIDHVHHAHTDGDSHVYFMGSKVVHMGDTYFHEVTWPYIDLGAGGSIEGLIASAKTVLSRVDSEWTIIPGHGPVASFAELRAYHDMLLDLRDGVKAGIDAGESLEQVQARGLTDAYEVSEGFISADKFIEAVYKSLTGETDYSPR